MPLDGLNVVALAYFEGNIWEEGTKATMGVGSCWLFFVVVFPPGMINVGVLAALVLPIFAEKSLPFGHAVRRLAAGVFLAYGAVVVILPAALPSTM